MASSVSPVSPGPSSHLGPGRAAAFREFLTAVRNALGDTDDDYYRYPALENALKQIA
jgi:hypothetical protein